MRKGKGKGKGKEGKGGKAMSGEGDGANGDNAGGWRRDYWLAAAAEHKRKRRERKGNDGRRVVLWRNKWTRVKKRAHNHAEPEGDVKKWE
jgi:hypothetical protein